MGVTYPKIVQKGVEGNETPRVFGASQHLEPRVGSWASARAGTKNIVDKNEEVEEARKSISEQDMVDFMLSHRLDEVRGYAEE